MPSLMERLVPLAYSSLCGAEQHRALIAGLAIGFRSHLISVQLDSGDHRHVTTSDYDADGRRMDEMAQVAAVNPVQSPWFASDAARQLPLIGVMSDEMTGVSSRRLTATDFYQTILRPFDILHSFVFFLSAHEGHASTLGLSRSARAGLYSEQEMSAARALLPHLRNVQSIQKAIATDPSTNTNDRPVWVLAADGSICWRNNPATGVTTGARGGDVLLEHHGKPMPVYAQDRASFCRAVESILSGVSLHRSLPLRDRAGAPRYIAHLHHCRREAFLDWLLTEPPAMLLVLHPLSCDFTSLEDFLRRLYRLTSAESRVACKLLELESIPQVVASLYRSEETIRSQIKALFAKTGTHTQAQLLKLLYALAQP